MRASDHHRADLQGLRAIAVLLVALNHAGLPLLPGGFVGVDVFFVLSGFLITGLLLTEARTTGVVLIGDSHALMWLPAVIEMALRDGRSVVPLLRTGCMPNRWVTDEGPASCRRWYRWAMNQVRRLHPLVTLVGGSIGERQTTTARAATDGIIATASALKGSGRVVVIGDPEGLSQDPIDCLLSRHASMASCTTTWPPASLLSYNRVATGARRLGVGFIATRGFVCFERRCPSVIGNTIAYWDNSHLTAAYAVQVADAFRTAYLRATSSRNS